MRSQRWFANSTAVLLAVCALWASSAAQGQYFRDDFEDGSATDGSPVTWRMAPWIPDGSFRVENGDLILTPSSTPPSLPGYDRSYSEIDVYAEGVQLQDVSIRTRVRGLATASGGASYALGIAGRETWVPEGKVGSGVWAGINSDGAIAMGYLLDTSVSGASFGAELGRKSVGLDFVAEDVELQLDFSGLRVEFRAWAASQPKPDRPQLIGTLPSTLDPIGTINTWIYPRASDWNKPVAFRYIHAVPLPEPSSLLLVGAGLLASAGRRRCGRSLGFRASTFAGGCLLALLLGGSTSSTYAATIFYDDFEDGSATDGSPVTWSKFPEWPATTAAVVNGDLRVSASNLFSSGVFGVPDVSQVNASIRAQVRLEGTGNQSVAVFVRGNESFDSGYNFEVGADGSLWFGISGSFQVKASDLRPTLEDVMLQVDAVGDRITAWAWRAGEPMPKVPAYSRRDTRIANGVPGVYYAQATTQQTTTGTAIYRYVQVADSPIPEPSTLGLLGLAAAGGMRRNSRRRLPSVR